MRSALLRSAAVALVLCCSAAAWSAESILDVLERSQQKQLDALDEQAVPADSAEAQVLQASFDRLLGIVTPGVPVRLVVVHGPLLAVCLMGKVVVANVSVAEMSESEREFVLAHELGHIAHGHWAQLGRLYQRYIPDEVVQEKTDAIAGELGRDASALAHDQEYEADAFALRLLRHMGQPSDTAQMLFHRLPLVRATPTHPGTQERLAHLQEVALKFGADDPWQ